MYILQIWIVTLKNTQHLYLNPIIRPSIDNVQKSISISSKEHFFFFYVLEHIHFEER